MRRREGKRANVKTDKETPLQQTSNILTTRLRRYLSPRQVLLTAIRITLVLQVITLVALEVIAVLRERNMKRMKKKPFPYPNLDEVQVGKNRLRLYASGNDLYPAMLDAIESARECIYLESYIWKDDAIGAEVKKRLIHKAEEGVEVYVIFDGFGNLVVPH